MKLKLIILLIVSWSIDMMAHGGHMATFNYQLASNNIILEFTIENAVLNHFPLNDACENYQIATAMCIMQYINKNTSLKINGNKIDFELLSSKQDERLFRIKMIARGDFSACESLSIENACFLEYDRKFENRIIVQKSDFRKSYRLNHKHKALNINTSPR